MRSILVIRLSSLGDVILSTPIVRQLQRTYPNAVIDVAVSDRFSEVYANNPRVRHVWALELSSPTDTHADELKLRIRESLPDGHYDLIVDLQNNTRSAMLRHNLGRETVKAPKHRLEKLALVYLKHKPAVTTPIVERYRSTISHLPLALDTDPPEVWLPEERAAGTYGMRRVATRGDISRQIATISDSQLRVASRGSESLRVASRGSELLRVSSRGYESLRVALAPGAHHFTKRWPVAKYAALCAMLVREGAVVALVGGPSDVEICDAIAKASGVGIERHDGATSLEETIRVLDQCNVVVSNDSGVMHLATARRIPVVAVFGSSVRELGFAPYGIPHAIVEHDVQCRPCSHIGRSRCPKGHFLCMESITPEEVHAAIHRFL